MRIGPEGVVSSTCSQAIVDDDHGGTVYVEFWRAIEESPECVGSPGMIASCKLVRRGCGRSGWSAVRGREGEDDEAEDPQSGRSWFRLAGRSSPPRDVEDDGAGERRGAGGWRVAGGVRAGGRGDDGAGFDGHVLLEVADADLLAARTVNFRGAGGNGGDFLNARGEREGDFIGRVLTW